MVENIIDYYEILDLKKSDFKSGNTLADKQYNSDLAHRAYIKAAAKWHPDSQWNIDTFSREIKEEKFKLIVKAHTILSNNKLRKLYDKGEEENTINFNLKIDWDKIGRYRKGSLEDNVGTLLFKQCFKQLKNNIKRTCKPNDEEYHNYNWEIYLNNSEKNKPLTISIVSDETEVLRLTNGQNIIENDTMPFKIYIFIPNNKIRFQYNEDKNDPFFGNIVGAIIEDECIYEGTSLKNAINTIKNDLIKSLQNFI